MRVVLVSTLVLWVMVQLAASRVTYTEDEIRQALREFLDEAAGAENPKSPKDSSQVVNRAQGDSIDVPSLDPESDEEDDAESQRVELPGGEKTPTNINPNNKKEQKQDDLDRQPPPRNLNRRTSTRNNGRKKRHSENPLANSAVKRQTLYSLFKRLNSKSKRIFQTSAVLWEGGRIPYTIDEKSFAAAPSELNELKVILKESIRQLKASTCVEWVERSSETDYVNIINDSGCYSYVGKISGAQPVSMQAYGCMTVHTMLHEMLHAMGTDHEQSRSDRAGMTSMIWNNIEKNNLNNFQMAKTSNAEPYDYRSLMQYELDSFGKDGGNSMKIPDKSLEYLISNKKVELTLYDIGEINYAYKCTAKCTNKCQNGGIVIVNEQKACGCKCPKGLKGDDCSQLDTSQGCGEFITLTAGQKKKIQLQPYTVGTACAWLVKGGANTRIKATIDSLDLPYNDYFDCYHWVEFRDYLIGDKGKQRCGTEGGATFTKMVIGDPSRMMILFDSVKHQDQTAGKGFSVTVEAFQSECSKYPCKNGGLCKDQNDGGYTCSCINGFSGKDCNDIAAGASTKCDFQDDYRGCVFQPNKQASGATFSLSSTVNPDIPGNENGFQYLVLTYGWEEKYAVLETSANFAAAERCLSFKYAYMGEQFYNDGYDTTATLTSTGSDAKENTLLKIGDPNVKLNAWTPTKVTIPSTSGLKLKLTVRQGNAEFGMDDIALKPGACS